jgi:hypothetical protein
MKKNHKNDISHTAWSCICSTVARHPLTMEKKLDILSSFFVVAPRRDNILKELNNETS